MPRIYAKDNVTTAKPDMITATNVGTKRALDICVVDESGNIIGGYGKGKIVTPTITVSTDAYEAGDCVGGKITLTDAMRVSGGTGFLQYLHIIDSSNIKPAFDILIFNSNPTAATLTDQSAMALSTDISKVIHHIPVYTSDYTSVKVDGAYEAMANININKVVEAVGSANLYAALNAVAAHDFVVATDLKMSFGFLQD
jgi:hypothetical protein